MTLFVWSSPHEQAPRAYNRIILVYGIRSVENVSAAHFHGPAKEGENADPMITIKQLDSPMKGSATLTEDQSTHPPKRQS
jgi:hypothetical protein